MVHPQTEYYYVKEPKWARIHACDPLTGHRLSRTKSVWVRLGCLDLSLKVDIGMEKDKLLRKLGQYSLHMLTNKHAEPDLEVYILLALILHTP